MKIDRLEAHDRLLHFKKQDFDIGQCCQDIINQRPFGDHAFYIFAHARTVGLDEKVRMVASGRFKKFEEVPEKTIIWQPRLTKPTAQTNSMLFKAYPGKDILNIIWIIPPRELWGQFKKGNVTENDTIAKSIHDFEHNRGELEKREPDDLSDEAIDMIYREISRSAKYPQSFPLA